MQITRAVNRTGKGPSDWFTGDVPVEWGRHVDDDECVRAPALDDEGYD
jgi:hypothetical protein